MNDSKTTPTTPAPPPEAPTPAAAGDLATTRLEIISRATQGLPAWARTTLLLVALLGVGGITQLTQCGQDAVRAVTCSDLVTEERYQQLQDEKEDLEVRVQVLEYLLYGKRPGTTAKNIKTK